MKRSRPSLFDRSDEAAAPPGPPDAWRAVLEARVARLGGRVVWQPTVVVLHGFGPDLGLDYVWIHAASAEPLPVPIEALEAACEGPVETWAPRLDALLDDRIRFHREEVRRGVEALVNDWPLVSPSDEDVARIELHEPPTDAVTRAREVLGEQARVARVSWLQLRELSTLEVLLASVDDLAVGDAARAALRRAVRRAASPAADIRELAATRVAVVRAGLAELEALDDDEEQLAGAVRAILMPLLSMVDDEALDRLL